MTSAGRSQYLVWPPYELLQLFGETHGVFWIMSSLAHSTRLLSLLYSVLFLRLSHVFLSMFSFTRDNRSVSCSFLLWMWASAHLPPFWKTMVSWHLDGAPECWIRSFAELSHSSSDSAFFLGFQLFPLFSCPWSPLILQISLYFIFALCHISIQFICWLPV